jgi:serine/threonine protein kinase
MTGRLIGHYRVLEQIGSGGMGDVFRARDERLGRDVALKLIRPAFSDNPDHLRRFEQEARAAATSVLKEQLLTLSPSCSKVKHCGSDCTTAQFLCGKPVDTLFRSRRA